MELNFELHGLSMDLAFTEGNLINLQNKKNGALFSFSNNKASLNVYIEKLPSNMSLNQFISAQIKVIKFTNFEESSIDFVRGEMNNLSEIKASSPEEIKTKFKHSKLLIIEKEEFRQIQIYVKIDSRVIVFGLNFLSKRKIGRKELLFKEEFLKTVSLINSIKKMGAD